MGLLDSITSSVPSIPDVSDITGAVTGAVSGALPGGVSADVTGAMSAALGTPPAASSGGGGTLGEAFEQLAAQVNQGLQASHVSVPMGPATPAKTVSLKLKSAATPASTAAVASQVAAANAQAAQAAQTVAASQTSSIPAILIGTLIGAALGGGAGVAVALFKWPVGVIAGSVAGALSGILYNAFASPGATFGYDQEIDFGFDADYGSVEFGPATVFSLKG